MRAHFVSRFSHLLIVDLTADAHDRSDHGKNFATRFGGGARHGMVLHERAAGSQVASFDAAATRLMRPYAAKTPRCGGWSRSRTGSAASVRHRFIARKKTTYGINGSGRSPLGLSYEQMKAELDKLNRKTIPRAECWPVSLPGTVDDAEMTRNSGKLKSQTTRTGGEICRGKAFP